MSPSPCCAVGIYLVEPFYTCTIATGGTHTKLCKFYRELHTSLQETKVEASIPSMENHIFPGISREIFESVKKSSGQKVLEVVGEVGEDHMEDVVALINHRLPGLATTLARRRRDYCLDTSTFPAQYPV